MLVAYFVALKLVRKYNSSSTSIEHYVNRVNKENILDANLEEYKDKVEDLEEEVRVARVLRRKKKHVITTTIEELIDEYEIVFEIFSNGDTSTIALGNNKKTIVVVCNIQEKRAIEAICWKSLQSVAPDPLHPIDNENLFSHWSCN